LTGRHTHEYAMPPPATYVAGSFCIAAFACRAPVTFPAPDFSFRFRHQALEASIIANQTDHAGNHHDNNDAGHHRNISQHDIERFYYPQARKGGTTTDIQQ
jgi:hypothetical protein